MECKFYIPDISSILKTRKDSSEENIILRSGKSTWSSFLDENLYPDLLDAAVH